jgi:dTDP-4-dehydrorhamnose 3,5-epimerase-like enzyme
LAFDDASLGIDWQVEKAQLQLSAKDTVQPTLDKAELFVNAGSLYA